MGADWYLTCVKTIRLDLLDLFGSDYVIEHCTSEYLEKAKEKERTYYIANCLKNINEIIANQFGGKYLSIGLKEALEPEKENTRTGDDIARDIIKRAGLSVQKQAEGGEME